MGGSDKGATPQSGPITELGSGDPPPRARVHYEHGDTLGRYTVLERVGEGGMGVVYAAYDPHLDRKLALKVLRSFQGTSQTQQLARQRLVREAQTMAKLAHPNVLTVHDVGVAEGQVFLALEFIEGLSLRGWLRERARSWTEIVDVFSQAGRGLGAAHAAGIVHRDFKPDNAMIGSDGRVRVADFGLARPSTDQTTSKGTSSSSPSTPPSLTRTGAIIGTPAYMAPEQFAGGNVDERTDQFAFAIAFWEALFGSRPFGGDDVLRLGIQVTAGKIRTPPKDSKVPKWLVDIIARGLAVEPDDRWPSMTAMVGAIAKRRVRTKTLPLVALGASAVATALALLAPSSEPSMCRSADQRVEEVWGEAQRDAGRHAFAQVAAGDGTRTWEQVATELDEYTRGWAAMHEEACEATHVHGEQSQRMLDLRMNCLSQRLDHARAAALVFAEADQTTVDNAHRVTQSLPSLSRCADVAALDSAVPPPDDDATAVVVASIRARLADVGARYASGHHHAGLAIAEQAQADADASGYLPALAESYYWVGATRLATAQFEAAVESLESGYFLALNLRHIEPAMDCSLYLMFLHGEELRDLERAEHWSRHVEALLGWPGATSADRARFEGHLGLVLSRQGKHAEALAALQRTLDTQTRLHGEISESVATGLSSLAAAYYDSGAIASARSSYERVLEIREQLYPTNHPLIGQTLSNLGAVVDELGEPQLALRHYQRSLAITELRLGGDHPDVAMALTNMAVTLHQTGETDLALKQAHRAKAILERAHGPDHDLVASAIYNLATMADERGDHQRALDQYLDAVARRQRALGPDHPSVANPLSGAGRMYLELGHPKTAIDYLQRSLNLLGTGPTTAASRSEIEFALARALHATEGDARRIAALTESARDGFRRLGDQKSLAALEAWRSTAQ